MNTDVLGKTAIHIISKAEGVITGVSKYISGEELYELTISSTGQQTTICQWTYPKLLEIVE